MEINNIYNEDSIEAMRNMESECVDLLVTDPPYKTITGGDSNGKNSERPKGMLSGNRKLFTHQNIKISDWMQEVYRVLKQGSHAYIFTNVLNLTEMLNESQKVGFKLHNLLCWEKNNCLGGNTQILVKNKKVGLIYRSNLKDLYRNYNEKNKNDWQICGENGIFKDIKNVFFNGKQNGVKITFRNGQEIFCTLEHQFLTNDGLKKVCDLNVGDIVCRKYDYRH